MSMNDIESQMRKINMLSRRELTQDDVYIFPVVLCDNDVDRDFEQFSNDAVYRKDGNIRPQYEELRSDCPCV